MVIRDIHFNGAGFSSNTGLSHTGGKLIVKHCVFESLTTGVSAAGTNNTTLPARMDLIDSDFYNNGTAVLSTGSGANSPGNSVVASTTVIRINGGNITGNGTGLNMVNQGQACLTYYCSAQVTSRLQTSWEIRRTWGVVLPLVMQMNLFFLQQPTLRAMMRL